MPPGLKSVARWNRLFAAACVTVVASTSAPAADTLLRCTLLSQVDFADTGRLVAQPVDNPGTRRLLEISAGQPAQFIVDITTGAVHGVPLIEGIWKIIQPGGGGNDTILTLDRRPLQLTDAINDYIRIRAWSNDYGQGAPPSPTRFLWMRLTTAYSGTCIPVS